MNPEPPALDVSIELIRDAEALIAGVVLETPLTYSPRLSAATGKEIYFKWENRQVTGSFKERGAAHFLRRIPENERARGVCAASAGNHALALSHHAAILGIPCTIVMPRSAPLVKVRRSEATGARVMLEGPTFQDAVAYAKEFAVRERITYVSPFDNALIIAGQGTLGLEIARQLSDFDTVIVPVGGGGLISGTAAALKHLNPSVRVIGAQSEWATHRPAEIPERDIALRPLSIADGIAVKVLGTLTKPLIDRYVDRLAAFSECEIASAVVRFLEDEHVVVEGAGAVGLAALLRGEIPEDAKRIVVVVSGSNIDLNLLSKLIEREMAERQQLVRLVISVPDRPGALTTVTAIIAGAQANVVQVFHDRSYTKTPGNVDIEFLLEVRDSSHSESVIGALALHGLEIQRL